MKEFSLLTYEIVKAIHKADFSTPTPIQSKVIPLVLDGKDIIAQAQTGSGKSGSFIFPTLELISRRKREGKAKIKALILTPTRELTKQIADDYIKFGEFLDPRLKVVSIIGGESIGEQLIEIQKGCDIVVATSGRLIDVLSKKQMSLEQLEFFILDEADKMLSDGFGDELDVILASIPAKRQNLLFSATYPPKLEQFVSKITKSGIEVSVENEAPTVKKLTQRAIEVNADKRTPLLKHLLKTQKLGQMLVFMANKRSCDNIANKFRKLRIGAQSFHGDLTQEERSETLADFKSKKTQILFATDLFGRGLDVVDIATVINYDLPRSPEEYIHRIGRTARAGKSGLAISFIGLEDDEHFKLIEKRANISLARESIEGFERIGESQPKPKGNAPIKGKRKSKKDKLREQKKEHL